MTRYHLDVHGNPAECRANQKACPRGGENEHYSTREEARRAFEAMNGRKQFASFRKENPWANLTIEEFAEIEENALREHLKTKTPYSDEEYDRHREYIRRVAKEHKSTHSQNTHRVKGKTKYKEERQALHREIISELMAKYADVPREGRILLTGGLPGSGKTTVVDNNPDLEADQYATVNPDDIKEMLIAKGGAPAIRGLLPMETNSLLQYESQYIADNFVEEISQKRHNLLLDKTMSSPNPISKTLATLRERGYSQIEAVFMDVDGYVAYDRIVARHRQGLDDYVTKGEGIGGRAVSGTVVSASISNDPHFNSTNAQTLVELFKRGEFTATPRIFDTSKNPAVEIPFAKFVGYESEG